MSFGPLSDSMRLGISYAYAQCVRIVSVTTWDDVEFSGIARVNFMNRPVMTRMCSLPELDFDRSPRRSISTNDMGSVAGGAEARAVTCTGSPLYVCTTASWRRSLECLLPCLNSSTSGVLCCTFGTSQGGRRLYYCTRSTTRVCASIQALPLV